MAEILDRLKYSVLVNLEIVFVESGNQSVSCDPGPLRARPPCPHLLGWCTASSGRLCGERGSCARAKLVYRDQQRRELPRPRSQNAFAELAASVHFAHVARMKKAPVIRWSFHMRSESTRDEEAGRATAASHRPASSHLHGDRSPPLRSIDSTWFGPLASKKPRDQSRRQSPTAQSVQSRAASWLLSAASRDRRGWWFSGDHRGWFNNLGQFDWISCGGNGLNRRRLQSFDGSGCQLDAGSRAQAYWFLSPTRWPSALRIQIPRPIHGRGKTMLSELRALRRAVRET